MHWEAGKAYRAKTANGDQIAFTVTGVVGSGWLSVDLDSAEGPEPNVLLNTHLLLWVSTEQRRTVALAKAAEEVIEALERSSEEP